MANFKRASDKIADKWKINGVRSTYKQNGTNYSVFMIFRTLTEDERGNRGIEGEELEVLIPAKLLKVTPLTGDRVTRPNDGTWSVKRVDTVQPTDTALLYKLLIGR